MLMHVVHWIHASIAWLSLLKKMNGFMNMNLCQTLWMLANVCQHLWTAGVSVKVFFIYKFMIRP